ncbi:MAG: thermosome, partial [Halobacteriales archaeon]
MGAQPLFIMSEGSQRTSGKDAQSSNITAGKAVAESVRTTLGPRGMDKMLVSDSGDVVITNDGATILQEMEIEHPAAQMIVEVAESQEEEVGDGTTTAGVLAGRLLSQAEDLLEQDVHPTTVVEGYHAAGRLAKEAVDDLVVDAEMDDELLRQVAESSMTGKGTGGVTAEALAETVVDAVRHVREDGVDRDRIAVHTQLGSSSSATELVEGIVIEEEAASNVMPTHVEDATVAIVDMALEVRSGEIDAEYQVDSMDQLTEAMESEESELRGYSDALVDAGVDVAFVTDDVDDRVVSFLEKEDVLVLEDIGNDDARRISTATGANRVGTLEDLEDADLGTAETVRSEAYGDDDLAFVEGGAAAEAVTVFVRGGTEHVTEELERAISDAIDVVVLAAESGEVVPGAGATEIAVSARVREEAASIEGRKQLAVEAFADAVDLIPRTLAENMGMDPIDALVDLRAAHERDGPSGLVVAGETGEVADPIDEGVLDPA